MSEAIPDGRSRLLRRNKVASRNDAFCVTFNAGGGIVADSDPAAELEEIKLKSKGIMSAIGLKDT